MNIFDYYEGIRVKLTTKDGETCTGEILELIEADEEEPNMLTIENNMGIFAFYERDIKEIEILE